MLNALKRSSRGLAIGDRPEKDVSWLGRATPVYHVRYTGLFSIRAAKTEIVLRPTAEAATFLFLVMKRDWEHRTRKKASAFRACFV
jgi:hypothetical protein